MENLVPVLEQIEQILKDSSPAIVKIAEILEKTSSTATHLIFVIFAAICAYFMHSYLKSQERVHEVSSKEKNREKQRKLISALLGDEIVLRWNKDNGIAEDFKRIFQNTDVQSLFKTIFKSRDLHVFEQCAHNIDLVTVFDDKVVVSHVIYVYMLCKDLEENLDNFRKQATIYLSIKEFSSISELKTLIEKQVPDSESSATAVIDAWNKTKKEFEKLDVKLLEVYSFIEDDYLKYIGDSKFLNESELENILATIREKLPEIASKRLAK